MSGSFWRDRRTFVTGGAGLLGGWLVRRLAAEGAEVVALLRDWVPDSHLVWSGLPDRVTVVRGDVRDQALLERVLGEYEVEVVLHLAAQTIVGVANRNPVSTFESNIGGTWSLLEAARRAPTVRAIVVASSDKAYGDHGTAVYDETMPLDGRHPYDASKACADLVARSYAATFDLPVAITRCGNLFGGGDLNWNRLVPGTIRSVLRQERPVIRSDGSMVRDYIYVEDGVAACLLLAERLVGDAALRGEAFNFSLECRTTVLELTRQVLAAMGSDLEPVVQNQARHELPFQALSTAKARDRLGWRPTIPMADALQRTVAWYREFFDGR